MKIFATLSIATAAVAAFVYRTNYAATGLWLDWNPDYGVVVNGLVNMLILGGCVVTAWGTIAVVDKVVETTMPDSVAVTWRRIVG